MGPSRASKTMDRTRTVARMRRTSLTIRTGPRNPVQNYLSINDSARVSKQQMMSETLRFNLQSESDDFMTDLLAISMTAQALRAASDSTNQHPMLPLVDRFNRAGRSSSVARKQTSVKHQNCSIRATTRKEEIRTLTPLFQE